MAVKTSLLFSLWGLILFVHSGSSFCNISCWTDYNVTVNCSCSAPVTHPVHIEVNCRDGFESEANASCEIQPPLSWCVMYPEDFDELTSVGTMCTSTATQQHHEVTVRAAESSVWELSCVVKARPPFDVQVMDSDGFYNITWEHANKKDCLSYRVRVRETTDLSKDQPYLHQDTGKHILIERTHLLPHVTYTVDVGAKMCQQNLYWGPWSEWSSPAEWRTAGSPVQMEGIKRNWLYVLLTIVPVVLGVVVYSQKTYLQKKFHLITFVPSPDEFFKPLYHNYGGDFKDWVKPVFSEWDYPKIDQDAQKTIKKKPDVLQWKSEKQHLSEDNEKKQVGHFLDLPQPQNNLLLFPLGGGSSNSNGLSSGHISIHTVMLSGEEELEDEERPRSSVEGQIEMFPQQIIQISNNVSGENENFEQHAEVDEPERVSLDSFVSHGLSEDGYPHVDLDTIDSGFGECSSPAALDSNMAEQVDLFQEHKTSNSNYVKQWMICSSVQENNVENGLHETQ